MGSSADAPDPIEETNQKNDECFIQENLQPSEGWAQWTHPKTQQAYSISLTRAENTSLEDLKSCLNLIEETSKTHYVASSRGWKPRSKLTEMKSPEMRYIIVRDAAAAGGSIRGFTSLMPTWEEGEPVVYCYEIHLKPEMRGTGLGRHLMGFLGSIAKHTPTVEKVMLTCFTRNTDAFDFYKRLGFDIDEISPEPRKFRSREIVPDYVIMSKSII
ncbi:acyl-CoA N-acyltransferase [Pestalotiopsis sp. NC0098]|nr:acyl-CoA N-acyltransferase [Pestalotiopsis sp. NC0098]